MNKYKIALCFLCLNKPYWQYLKDVTDSAKQFFLKGHDVDFLTWSDMPTDSVYGATKIFPTEACEWPLPTLMRWNLMLQQEETLREYDYVFFCDVDMKFVSRVGDEILGDGLTMAQHPMYAVSKRFIPPYEPNSKSTSFIPRPGRVVVESGKKRFEPLYAAGGFQGGRTDEWLKAMKVMKEMTEKDFSNNYIPVWNDESVWNRYLFDNPPSVVLSPSYVYPDTLNRAYYRKVWGRDYVPKLVTITKKFSLTQGGGKELSTALQNI